MPEVHDGARALAARTDRGSGPLPPVAAGARPQVSASIARAAALHVENEALYARLSRVSRAIQGLASDLAASRRECRRQELEIRALRSENSLLQDRIRAGA